MQIAFDVDDFSPLNHRFDLLNILAGRYKDFKITLFTVPWEIRLSPLTTGTPITDEKWVPWVDEVKSAIKDGWTEIAIHGLTHAPLEFANLSYTEARNRIIVAQKMFQNVGIDVCDLFKAPQWAINDDGKKAVKDLGLRLVEDGYYNWNIKNEMPKKAKIIAHGHIQDERATMNGLDQSLSRLMKIPSSAKWKFVSEVL